MKIVFLHNLQTAPTPEQAEFDTPETVQAITEALQDLGHEVVPLDAAGSVPRLVSVLQTAAPDLVLNTAEGSHGRGREGFYPGLLDQMGLAYTGSDAYVCTVTLDKRLTNLALSAAGIPVPRSALITNVSELSELNLRYPVIAKPNFEGSSKGVDQNSVSVDAEELHKVMRLRLEEFPLGVLVEEFIEGRDVTVPYIEGLGVLEPAHYEFSGPAQKYSIYDFDLKQNRPDDVAVVCPADVSRSTAKKLKSYTQTAIKVLGVRDLGRVDYRVTPDGELFLIEVNALPSLEPGAAIYLSAAQKGYTEVGTVLSAVLKSAIKRRKKAPKAQSAKPLRVGVIHNLKRAKVDLANDQEAEFDSKSTVDALCQAVSQAGFEAVPLEARPDLPSQLSDIDVAFNIAEGRHGRYRESQIPALLEMLDIPFTGSEAGSLAVCHDKALAKRLVQQAGVATAKFQVVESSRQKIDMDFPLLVKPVAEGSSKGVALRSVVTDQASLKAAIEDVLERYSQPALVEEFLSGREFTVGILGDRRLRVLPILEIEFVSDLEHPIYSFEHKQGDDGEVRFVVPASVERSLQKRLEQSAKLAFKALGCRDVARIDFRLDSSGVINFIECNPLPGLTPNYSDLCVIGKAAGLEYPDLVAQILKPAIRRYHLKKVLQPTPER
jgi:D-alanine-D-alanine ligase